jgi:hypothetical protein
MRAVRGRTRGLAMEGLPGCSWERTPEESPKFVIEFQMAHEHSTICIKGRNHGSKVEGDHHGERGSASLYGGLRALPSLGSRSKVDSVCNSSHHTVLLSQH